MLPPAPGRLSTMTCPGCPAPSRPARARRCRAGRRADRARPGGSAPGGSRKLGGGRRGQTARLPGWQRAGGTGGLSSGLLGDGVWNGGATPRHDANSAPPSGRAGRTRTMCIPSPPHAPLLASMELLLLVVLMLLNGVFAMSEMALAASRKARLQAMAECGRRAARSARCDCSTTRRSSCRPCRSASPPSACSTASSARPRFSEPLAHWLHATLRRAAARRRDRRHRRWWWSCITFVTIVFGELVPKRIGQIYPETVARLVARPMRWLAKAAGPFVQLLSGVHAGAAAPAGHARRATAQRHRGRDRRSLEEGVDAGVIEEHEHQMVRNVFRLDDRQITSMMVPRGDIVWLDADRPCDDDLRRIGDERPFPVSRCAAAASTTCWAWSTRASCSRALLQRHGTRPDRARCSRRCSCPRR